VLQIKNLKFEIDKKIILEDISLTVRNDEILSIIGLSGCGKSSILKCIAGINKPSYGLIVLDGVDITNTPISKRNVTLVFQDNSLFPHMTVKENMTIACNSKIIIEKVLDSLEISHLSTKYPYQMSGGEQQRATIARAIAHKPQLLLLDEPFSSVDTITTKLLRTKVYELLKEFKITTILVTHDLDDVYEMSSRCVVMKPKTIEQLDSLETLYNTPISIEVAKLFGKLIEFDGFLYRPEHITIISEGYESKKAIVKNVKFHGIYNILKVDINGIYIEIIDYKKTIKTNDIIYLKFNEGMKL